MTTLEKIKNESIKEYGTAVVQERYKKLAVRGFWESEEILVKKYFKEDSHILDMACGSGRTALPLYKLGYKVTGVDLTPEMIVIAKDVAKEENADITYQVEDATNLSFNDEFFNGVLLPNNGLASIPGHNSREQTLNEIHRVLKPGGHVILSIPLRYYARHYLLHLAKTWIEHFILKPLKYSPTGIDFGDYFYHRHNKGETLEQVQFLHFFSKNEIEKLILKSGFKIVEKKLMSEISKKDGISKEGSLSEKDDTSKSPIFYVCKKVKI